MSVISVQDEMIFGGCLPRVVYQRAVLVTIWGFLVGVLGLENLVFVRYVAREGSRGLI